MFYGYMLSRQFSRIMETWIQDKWQVLRYLKKKLIKGNVKKLIIVQVVFFLKIKFFASQFFG